MPWPCPGFKMSRSVKIEKREDGSGDKVWGGNRERSGESVADSGRSSDGVLDAQLWHACAGGMVQLPRVGSKVMYFPQGHGEHAASPPEFPPSLGLGSTIPCRVLSVKFLADRETDEVYARIRLQPEIGASAKDLVDDAPPSPPRQARQGKPDSFAKTLTQSDANNGGGFSVPRYCAETIFPRLDFSVDPPVQNVLAKDVHGEFWKFRHIYRGTPRRHLLTTGWSTFVNQKKLVAGDSIVFLRSATGELCVGVRRSTRGAVGVESSAWHLSSTATAGLSAHRAASRWEAKGSDNSYDFLGAADIGAGVGLNRVVRPGVATTNSSGNFSRNRARVTAKSVLEAATSAAAGQAFEVVYYPRATISEFCVKAHAVKAALQQRWGPGMRFKMALETEDSSRVSWFMGTISKVQDADPVRWPNSPWKMLQVSWDEQDLLQGVTRVSPWQVELVSPMQLPPFSLPKKKVRVSQPPEHQLDGQSIMGLNSVLGHMNPWHGFTDSVPAGMQGARHNDRIYGFALKEVQPSKIQQGLLSDNFNQYQERVGIGGARVSTELNMGNFAHHEQHSVQNNVSALLKVGNSSRGEPASSSSVRSCGGSSSTKNAPFLLFGKAIDTTQSVKAQPQHSGGSSSDGPGHDCVSDGNQSEVLDRKPSSLSVQGYECKPMGISSLRFQWGESLDSARNGKRSLKWLQEQAGFPDKDKDRIADDTFAHCKVFRESEEVGRTVDLSFVKSYEELYDRLARMFSIEKSEILNRVVYMDTEGSPRNVGDEPYREFIQRVRRLKILSEIGSESMTK